MCNSIVSLILCSITCLCIVLSQTAQTCTSQCSIEADWDPFMSTSTKVVDGLLSNLHQSKLCKCRKCSGRWGECHWREFHTWVDKMAHTHTQIPSNPLNYDPDALRTFCGWRLCTAARISGVGIISCQRHIASWWGTLQGPESPMISHDISVWTLHWTDMTFKNVETPDLHSVSTTAMKVGQVVVQPAAVKLVKVSLGVPHHPCISMLISY